MQSTTRHDWRKSEVLHLFGLPFNDLLFIAHGVHRQHFDPNAVQISTLLSIKTGGCAEDCAYCPQSAKFSTDVKASKLMGKDDVLAEARKAKEAGASRFCMGAAWREPKDRDMDKVVGIIKGVKALGLETCATLGMLTAEQATRLKSCGLDYYNHNLDTSEAYYGNVITTRTYQDRLDTLEHVREAGMHVCCGGIVGMGEKVEDRAELLRTLANMPEHPESVPINMLVQVEGTALFGETPLDEFDFIRAIAVARILMPKSFVRLSAGREQMNEQTQALCFFAGANSIFYGEKLLTTPNPEADKDKELFGKLGLTSSARWNRSVSTGSCAVACAPRRMNTDWYASGLPHVWLPYTQMKNAAPPLPVVATQGCRIKLADGRELIDGIASWWSACHGYNHPHILAAIETQLKIMPHVMFAGLAHEPALTLAKRLVDITPEGLNRVFFADSGSVAVEVALKIALQYWRNSGKPHKERFICFKDGYHGDTLGAMSVSDPEKSLHKAFRNSVIKQYVVGIPTDEYTFAEFDALLEGVHGNVAGLIIEPLVQGAGGMRFHSADILGEIHRIAKKYDILFIADEIATGFYRTGNLFACDEAGIAPDIMCLGKALTGGTITLGATLVQEAIFAAFLDDNPDFAFMHGPTFMANPLACAAANASLYLFFPSP